jgi:formylglycine-generating enzyme required for sulfatase activity
MGDYKSGSTFYVESGYDNYPVIFASWYGVKAFCNWISVKTGKNYQLPSEAQWEFAARSRGKAFKYAWGSGTPTRSNGGNIADETAKKKYSSWTIWEGYTDGYIYTSPVGIFGTNELGIYDMSGNVWEWCEDDWHGNYNGAPTDGRAWVDSPRGSYRVLRGGGWDGYAQYCRVSYRFNFAPGNRGNDGGFRLACFP